MPTEWNARGARFKMAEADGEAAMQPGSTLDATGLLCPLPALKARRALRSVPTGGLREVLATDPGATKDFEHFCRTTAGGGGRAAGRGVAVPAAKAPLRSRR